MARRRRGTKRRRRRFWIGKAIKKPGALTRTVRRRFGARGFTRRGTIKVEVLRKLAKQKGVTGYRARMALTLRKLRR